MTPKSKPKSKLTQNAYNDLKKLPGNIRRQMIVAINDLERNPRPSYSKQLILEDEEREIRRLRISRWRIVYLLLEDGPVILGIRQRPPYDYSDVEMLVEEADK